MPDDLQKRPANHSVIELRLRSELDEARANYESANREYDVAAAHARELGLHTGDGAYALHQASRQQIAATAAYSKAVDRFCDYILRSQLPED
jgi:hypothetical protein